MVIVIFIREIIMKRLISIIAILATCLVLTAVVVPAQANSATITLLNPPAGGELHLSAGESYTFNVAIDSDTPFVQAIALVDQYFPGRGVRDQGAQVVVGQTSTVLHMTVTGVGATARLANGVYPITLIVGVRYGSGQVVYQAYPINVFVS
jgi:hypothetical protein